MVVIPFSSLVRIPELDLSAIRRAYLVLYFRYELANRCGRNPTTL